MENGFDSRKQNTGNIKSVPDELTMKDFMRDISETLALIYDCLSDMAKAANEQSLKRWADQGLTGGNNTRQ